jgi:hypothetical protein
MAFLRAAASRARRAVILEVGRIDLLARDRSAGAADDEAYVRGLMAEAGLADIRLLAATSAVRRNDRRLLFAATPRAAAPAGAFTESRRSAQSR